MDPIDRLIVALDVTRMEKAIQLIDELEQVKCFKIGPQLFMRGGAEIVRFIKDRGSEVLLDLKLHDIRKVVVETIQAVDEHVDYLTVHAAIGYNNLEAAAKAATNAKIITVVALTSESPEDFPTYAPRERATMAKACGTAGCVTPGTFVMDVGMRFPEGLIFVPGIRLESEDVDDQVNITTPEYAVRFGADKIIVGRPIYNSTDPQKAVERVLKSIEEGERARQKWTQKRTES